jgi:hypothetical protein
MLSGKTNGMKSFLLFISLLLMATLACQTLLGDSDSEAITEETSIEPLPADNSVDSTELLDEQAIEEEISEEVVEDSDQDAASETASEAASETEPETDLEVEEDDGSDVQESSETADDPEESSEQTEARPLSEAEPLVLGKIGFVQEPEGTNVAYAFHIENPNADFGIQDSEYQIAVYDSDGTVLDTDSGFINLVLPSEETAIGSSVWLDEGLRAAEIEVQINSGEPVILDSIPALAIATLRYFDEEFLQRATGVLESQFGEHIEDIIVTVVAYDSEGNIVGSGYTYVDWIDPGESTGVEAYITALGEVDSIVMYPRTSYGSLGSLYGALPEGAANFELIDFGHFQDEFGVTFGLVTQNPNPNFAIEDAKYSATAYANDGSVLFVNGGYFDLILPGDRMVAGGVFYLDSGEEIAGIDYRVRAGEFVETDPIPLLGAENINYLADEYSPTVTGEVLNPFSWDLEDVRVWAILYDEDDKIVGSGYDYVEFIPANGKAATEIYVDGRPDPARVELYPAVTYYEEVEGPPE